MSTKISPLNYDKHKSLFLNFDKSFSHISTQNIVPLAAFEYIKASSNFPIVFIKQQSTGKYKSVALLGLEENENLIFSNGQVNSNYIPCHVKRYPFSVGEMDNETKDTVLCLDENSALLSTKKGELIFNSDGQLSDTMGKISEFIVDLIAKDEATTNFIDFLDDNDLIQPAELTLTLGDDGKKQITGVYKVDEVQLNKLSEETVLALYNRKYFAAIYSHLASLSQFTRLLHFKKNRLVK
jgi:hypothetical protein